MNFLSWALPCIWVRIKRAFFRIQPAGENKVVHRGKERSGGQLAEARFRERRFGAIR